MLVTSYNSYTTISSCIHHIHVSMHPYLSIIIIHIKSSNHFVPCCMNENDLLMTALFARAHCSYPRLTILSIAPHTRVLLIDTSPNLLFRYSIVMHIIHDQSYLCCHTSLLQLYIVFMNWQFKNFQLNLSKGSLTWKLPAAQFKFNSTTGVTRSLLFTLIHAAVV